MLGVIIIALAAFLAIAMSKTDPVVIIGFATVTITGLLAFLRAGQAADEIAKAKKDINASANITTQAAATVQEIKVSIDGRMEDLLTQTKLAASNSATLVERSRGEVKAADLAVSTGAALAAAQSSPAIGPVPNLLTGEPYGHTGDGGAPAGTPAVELSPIPVTIVQPPHMPVPVDVAVKADEGGTP